FSFIGIQNSSKKLPFYYYPSGLIVNIGEENRTHWGNSIVTSDLETFESISDFSKLDSYTLKLKNSQGEIYEEEFKLKNIRKT
ncbi:serine/threonine protein phosphatase, partial [Leptospira levettii]